jgi:hypothetical protein
MAEGIWETVVPLSTILVPKLVPILVEPRLIPVTETV